MNKKISNAEKMNVLNLLAGLGKIAVGSFFPEKYSHSKIYRDLFRDNNVNQKQVSSMFSRMQKEGLVERSGSKKRSMWSITKNGRIFIKNKSATRKTAPVSDGIIRLVTFDIPEKEKNKRKWIRRELAYLNYKILQKSVWIGTTPFTEDFIHDLKFLHLDRYIHIFSVNKTNI